jgi:hypothetical protein
MTRKTALITTALLFASAAAAQTGTTAPPPKPTPHQPGVTASPSTSQAPAAKPASTKIDPAKEAAIRKLMEITQSAKLGDNINQYIANQVQGGLRQALPPDRLSAFMLSFNQKLAANAPPSAVATAMVPYYDKLLSLEDLQGLIAFYESPLGQRTLKALPQVVSETEGMATQMQQRAAMAVLQNMANDYPELKAMLAPPPGAGGQEAPPVTPVK